MGRTDFRPSLVRQTANLLLQQQRTNPQPLWLDATLAVPPPEILTRTLPVTHQAPPKRGRRNTRRPSKLFRPQRISYEEDALRSQFFADHPWELARPRVLLEGDGRDAERVDWGREQQTGRPQGGESVVQRQAHLIRQNATSHASSYDQARRELYRARHDAEVEARVQREEALAVGALFGPSRNEIGMQLENATFDKWRQWAEGQVVIQEQARAGNYSGGAVGGGTGEGSASTGSREGQEVEGATTRDDGLESLEGGKGEAVVEEVKRNVPGSRTGLRGFGGAATHP